MALVIADRVKVTTTTTGTGDLNLASAATGFQDFSAIGDGNTTYYAVSSALGSEWEVGIGTYTASGATLSRDTIFDSSNSGSAVNFSAGTKDVYVVYPASKAVMKDAAGSVPATTFAAITATTANITTATLTNGTVSGTPSIGNSITNKTYVDNLATQAVTYHSPCRGEVSDSEGNLNAVYNNGSSGVGATLTNNGTLAAFAYGGISDWAPGERVLIYNQTTATQNGVYTITTVGDGSTAWVLTRATDADSYAINDPDALGLNDAFFIQEGNGSGELYVCNTSGTITFGTTNITFEQIASAAIYSAGTGLDLTGTTFSHEDTSSQASVNNSGNTFIQDVTLDGFGHVTALTSATAVINDATLTLATSGTGLSGSASFTANDSDNATFTVTSNATNANTPSTIVARDASGNFSAGTITANLTGNVTGNVTGSSGSTTGNAATATALQTARTIGGVSFDGTANIDLPGVNTAGNQSTSGNAATATKWATGRTITLTGDVTGVSGAFDGSGNLSFATTIAANSVALGTDTTGNYVGTITGGTGITSTGATSGEGINHTLAVDLNELSTSTTNGNGDYFAVVDSADGAQYKLTKANIALSEFNNDSGWTSNVGDITGVTAGSGLTGGGDSGSVTLNVGAGTGISVAADTVGLATAGAGAATYSSGISAIQVDAYGRVTSVTGSAGYTTTTGTVTSVASGSYLTGGPITTSGTLNVDATSANTASKVVARDASGNFSAGTITAALSGNASTATTLATARTINGVSFNGSANITVEPYIEDDESTAATRYLVFTDNTTAGYKRLNEDSALNYNPSTNVLTAGTFSASSDRYLKQDISNVADALSKVKQLNGVEFTWIENGVRSAGVIAQDVQQVLPQAVNETDNGHLTVQYDALHALLIEAVKELTARVEELEAK